MNGCTKTSAGPKLSVSQVFKSFPSTTHGTIDAVVDVSFDVVDNELCVLLGPSGCGKSTVLRMVAGLEEPTEGTLTIDGRRIDGPGGDRGMVFQSYTSFDWLTVQENVEYGMRLNGVPRKKRRDRADQFISLVQLEKFRDAYPTQLSGGMKQRVAIARTLANSPSMLLMDEPFGALDAETRWTMQELLLNIMRSSRTTVLLVTHDIQEAIFLADRILFMTRHPGRIRENLTTEFKSGSRIADKEVVIDLPGYSDLERHIMHMMPGRKPQQGTPVIDAMNSDSRNKGKDMSSVCGMPTRQVVTGQERHVSTVEPEFDADDGYPVSERAGVDRQAAWGI